MSAPLSVTPAPGTEHPTLRHIALEVRMFMAERPRQSMRYVAGMEPLSARWRDEGTETPPTSISPRVLTLTLTMHRCMGPAVFTGDIPFAWEWEVAVDDLGRFVASESWHVNLPDGHAWGGGW